MNTKLVIRGLFSATLALAAVACANADSTHSGDLGISSVQFQDVAVPAGMKLVERFHESHSREAAGWRYGHFEYVGKTTPQEATTYLLERMPQHSWKTTVDETAADSTRRLQFKRGAYVVDYRIERIDGETHLVIDYDTKIEGR